MKTSQSNEMLGAANVYASGGMGMGGVGGGDMKSSGAGGPNQKMNWSSSDIDTLKMREIEALNFERIKKKSEKVPMANMGGRNQQKGGGGGGGALDPHGQDDSDDYINLNDCSSKKGKISRKQTLFFLFILYFSNWFVCSAHLSDSQRFSSGQTGG